MTPEAFFKSLKAEAESAGVFEDVRLIETGLECLAEGPEEDAFYRVGVDGGKLWVSLVTPDRWLSESIETDLLHQGDKLEELLEEEMVDLGYNGPAPTFEHYRSDDKLFTFRTPVCDARDAYGPEQAELARIHLLGYEACFRQLGDMSLAED